jgi:hypothetical protein
VAKPPTAPGRRCGHVALGNGFEYVCTLKEGHAGLHEQRLQLERNISVTNWGDDGLAPHATKYPENGSYTGQRPTAHVDYRPELIGDA